MKLPISSRSRVLVISMTQTGKTTLAEAISRGFAGPAAWPRQLVVIVDSRRAQRLRELVPEESRSIPFDRGGWCRVCPLDGDEAEPYLEQVFARGDVWLWLDELGMIGGQHRWPLGLTRIYRQGMERNIGVVALTQDPKGIPTVARSQSDSFVIGPNGSADYLDEAARIIHQEPDFVRRMVMDLPPYGFLWWTWAHGREGRPPEVIPPVLGGGSRGTADERPGPAVRQGGRGDASRDRRESHMGPGGRGRRGGRKRR